MIAALKARALALRPWQQAIVVAVLVVTVIGAAMLVWGFTVWNERKVRHG